MGLVCAERIFVGKDSFGVTLDRLANDWARDLLRFTTLRRPPILFTTRGVLVGPVIGSICELGTAGTAMNLEVAGVKGALAISWV